MFKTESYIQRRNQLKQQIGSGLLVFLGNNESPMNYPDNGYRFRQDSTYLYYWGLELPGLAAAIDLDEDKEIIFGNDFTLDDTIWMGPQPRIKDQAARVGVKTTAAFKELETTLAAAVEQGRKIHFLPQYRHDNIILLSSLLGVSPQQLNEQKSLEFAKAVIKQRSIKSDEEIAEIESVFDITYVMHTYAMKHARPGTVEHEIAGAMEGIALAGGGYIAYPVIFSIHGETLHNHHYGNTMQTGDIAVNDCGSASPGHYASDITRTIPVSGKFTEKQKEVYQIVLDAMEGGIAKMQPGVPFMEVHLHSASVLLEGLKSLGLVKGNLDAALAAGAQGLFFPHGVGHMMGLDVHDMENLGEDYVGYDDEIKRSSQFGLSGLRLGKRLKPGFVATVEPGIYFIPALIDRWQAENKLSDFINYDAVEKYRDFGGIRIEENVVVAENGHRILGKPIPKTITDVEAMAD